MSIRSAALLGLLASLVFGTPAQSQSFRPVNVTASGLFGNEVFNNNTNSTVIVELRNKKRTPFRGTITVSSNHWSDGKQTYTKKVDLAPLQSRTELISIYVQSSSSLSVEYKAGDQVLGTASLSSTYGSGSSVVAVMADPPRLRASLVDTSGVTKLGQAIEVVRKDTQTGDPILPSYSRDWDPVSTLVVTSNMLERIGETELQALIEWVHQGGQVVLFAPSTSDFAKPAMKKMAPSVGPAPIGGMPVASVFVPVGAEVFQLQGAVGFTSTDYGGDLSLGFGCVRIATYDGNTPAYSDSDAVFAVVTRAASTRAHIPFLTSRLDVKSSLDPNQGFIPALGFVALLLLLYVFVVGPINFTYVEKKGTPTLALLTTPIIAVCCLGLMIVVGYIAKGTSMRFRAVEISEVAAFETARPVSYAATTRVIGYFPTRPVTFDIVAPPKGSARLQQRETGGRLPQIEVQDSSIVVRDVRTGLWDTVFAETTKVEKMDGSISFTMDESGRASSVTNTSTESFKGAFVIDANHNLFMVGPLAAKQTASIPVAATMTIAWTNGGTPTPKWERKLTSALSLPMDHVDMLKGAENALRAGTQKEPVLILVREQKKGLEEAGMFARDKELRLMRVTLDPLEGVRVKTMNRDTVQEEAIIVAPPVMKAGESGLTDSGLTDAGTGDASDGGAP